MSDNFSRLRELIEKVLPAVPEDGFNINWWRWHKKEDCKTVHCACGWAAVYPPFMSAGLTLLAEDDGTELVYQPFVFSGRIETGYQAAASFFGITVERAIDLFSPDSYLRSPTKQEVIDRIKEFLDA